MAMLPIGALGAQAVQPNAPAARGDASGQDEAAVARTNQALSDGANISPIDKKVAILNAQKTEASRDEAQNTNQPNEKQVDSALEKLNKFVSASSSNVQFSVDAESGIRIISVVDKETGEILRQMPSKEIVEMAKALDKLQGLIIKGTTA